MILGISGKAGSGKDTVADLLVQEFNFVKVSLADPLKRICRDVFAFTDEQLWGPSGKRNEPDLRYPQGWHRAPEGSGAHDFQGYLTPRRALQTLGTEWGRECYPDVWVEYAVRMARLVLDPKGGDLSGSIGYDQRHGPIVTNRTAASGVAIPDVRFKNEVDGLKKAGAKLIRVKRPDAGLSGNAGAHRSEMEQDEIPDSDFDFVINNDGSLEDLCLQVEQVMKYLKSEAAEQDRVDTFAKALSSIGSGEYILTKPVTSTLSEDGKTLTHQVSLEKVVSLDHLTVKGGVLSDLLQKRAEDIQAGRLMEYDDSQKDIPPFKRTKNP